MVDKQIIELAEHLCSLSLFAEINLLHVSKSIRDVLWLVALLLCTL